MFVLDNVPLNAYSTMRLGGVAAHLVEITSRFEAEKAVNWAQDRNLPFIVIGHGSNIIWKDEGFSGLVIVNSIKHFEIYQQDSEIYYLTAGAGEVWDKVVERSTQERLSGIETLSLIPGTTGATPVQNVGAYGSEIADVLMTLEAYDVEENKLITMRGSDCNFTYRGSRFKSNDKQRFIITAVTLRLTKTQLKPPFYKALQTFIDTNKITDFSPKSIRKAVIAIREAKLPDPAIHPNNGSFFQNPIISRERIKNLIYDYPEIMYWEINDSEVKISAAWLVEHAGFKDYHDVETGMSTWENQPLVFVNEHAKATKDLLTFRDKISSSVKDKFGIGLNQEPEILPN